jgi:hypothetical protein
LIDENDLLKHFRCELSSCEDFDTVMALISRDGLALIESQMQQCLKSGGLGGGGSTIRRNLIVRML